MAVTLQFSPSYKSHDTRSAQEFPSSSLVGTASVGKFANNQQYRFFDYQFAMEGNDNNFEAVEWILENFSCWCKKIHGDCLQESQTGFALYPRGLNGEGEYLVLRIPYPFYAMPGELSFESGSGFVIKTALNETNKQGDHAIATGPRYREVIAQAKQNRDTLTLRCTLKTGIDKKYHGHTAIDVCDTTLKIPVETFKDLEQDQTKLLSNICYNLDINKDEIEIVASASSSTPEDGKIFFKFKPKSRSGDVLIRTSISLQNGNGFVVKSEENDYLVLNDNEHKFSELLDKKIMTSAEGNTLLLQIKIIGGVKQEVCYISEPFVNYYKDIPQIQNAFAFQLPSKSVNVLLQELMCLYQDHDFSDFELVCGNTTFPTHRSILSARSPVLKTMLSNDMKEAATCSMDITDLDPHTLCRFLIFLYTGTVSDLTWKSALTLYYAADKYQVLSLKDECSTVMSSRISISNVCDILSLADKHQDENLNLVTKKFILENYNSVLRSDEWESYMEKEPYLLLKTLTSISKKSNVGKIEVKSKTPITQFTPLQFKLATGSKQGSANDDRLLQGFPMNPPLVNPFNTNRPESSMQFNDDLGQKRCWTPGRVGS